MKPVIRAKDLKKLAEEMISAKGGDPSHTVINKASLVFPFEFPSDYTEMDRWPQILSPTVKISSDGKASFMGLTDSSSSAENQGDVNRSLSNYAPDITYHMQEILKIDEKDPNDSRTKRFLKETLWDCVLWFPFPWCCFGFLCPAFGRRSFRIVHSFLLSCPGNKN